MNTRKSISILSGVLSLLLLVSSTKGQVYTKRITSTAKKPRSILQAPVQERSTILFLVDGCRADFMYEMAERGLLPNIKRVMDSGVIVQNAISVIPSLTYSCVTSLVTGRYPGEADIVGHYWFDRERLRERTYLSLKDYYWLEEDTDEETLFQLLAPRETAAILLPLTRGASSIIRIDYNYVGMGNYLIGRWEFVDTVYAQHIDDIINYADKRGIFPVLSIFHMPSTDWVGHSRGNYSEEYVGIIENFDRLLGEIIGLLEHNGVLEKISIIVMADHGQVVVDDVQHLDIRRILREGGVRKIYELEGRTRTGGAISKLIHGRDDGLGDPGQARIRFYDKYDIILSINGRMANIYVKCTEEAQKRKTLSWSVRPSIEQLRDYPISGRQSVDLVELFLREEGIGFVVAQSEMGIEIFTREGHSRVEKKKDAANESFRYIVVEGLDPLEYSRSLPHCLLDGSFHQGPEWFNATAGEEYPGVISQIGSLFASTRSGDIILFANEGWDFDIEHKYSSQHGGIERIEMRFPFTWKGPDIRRGVVQSIKLVDIFPTVLEYLGVQKDRIGSLDLDGESFLDEIIDK